MEEVKSFSKFKENDLVYWKSKMGENIISIFDSRVEKTLKDTDDYVERVGYFIGNNNIKDKMGGGSVGVEFNKSDSWKIYKLNKRETAMWRQKITLYEI